LYKNQLTGTIPPNLLLNENGLVLSLADNNLSGELPAYLQDVNVIQGDKFYRGFDLYNNNFTFSDIEPNYTTILSGPGINGTDINNGLEIVTQKAVDDCKLKLFKAGTLLVAMYGEGKTRGQVTELTFDATINQACAAIIVDENKIEKAYLKIRLLENYAAIRQLAEGGNQPNLNLSKVRSISILVPSRKEQIKIVKKVETLFAIADKMEANLANAQKRVDNLTQSILAKAFRGELL